jgi:glycerophosphoryl diester phosphodiesterase
MPVRWTRGLVRRDNGRFRVRNGPPFDPTLADALERIPAHCRVLLDPKETRPERRRRLVRALAEALPDRARFVVSTGDLEDLMAFRDAGFETWRTLKQPDEVRRVAAGHPLPERGTSVRHTALDAAGVAALHRVTDAVVAWTVNDVRRARELRDLGVDGVTTDRPEVMAALAGA